MSSYKITSRSVSIPKSTRKYDLKTVTLGNYKIQRKSIGKGSFSKIYVGTCILTDEQVAVKIIKKKNVKNENNILREIKIMSMIQHANVLCLLDVLVSDNKYYLVMEYCNMGDLKKYMKDKDLTESQLKYYMKQIRDGMWELHNNNIIHRDLKPQNILVTQDDRLKISDFGFAKSYSPDLDLQQTMCGSPLYMAPEILKQQRYTDSADLWSIGVIMYELFFNIVPINGNNIVDLMKNIQIFVFNPPNTKQCNTKCLDLMNNLLQKDPVKRYTWDEFYYNNWFTNANVSDNLGDNLGDNLIFSDNLTDNLTESDNFSGNVCDNLDDGPDFCMFQMDEDENVLYRSDVSITHNYLENYQNKNNTNNIYDNTDSINNNTILIKGNVIYFTSI